MRAKRIEEIADIIVVNNFDIQTISEPSNDLLRVISSIEDKAEKESVVQCIPTNRPVAELLRNIALLKDSK